MGDGFGVLQKNSRQKEKDFPSTLSPHPRSLRELWLEYKFGIDVRKQAEQFTTNEKNSSSRLKQMYHQRNVLSENCMKM
jgi:hypothetical protein